MQQTQPNNYIILFQNQPARNASSCSCFAAMISSIPASRSACWNCASVIKTTFLPGNGNEVTDDGNGPPSPPTACGRKDTRGRQSGHPATVARLQPKGNPAGCGPGPAGQAVPGREPRPVQRWNGPVFTGSPLRLQEGGLVIPRVSRLPPLITQVNSLPSLALSCA